MSVKKARTGSLIILTFQERVRANPCESLESHHWLQSIFPNPGYIFILLKQLRWPSGKERPPREL